jgi:hypothetical protein
VATGTITWVEAGWFGEGMAISITGSGLAGCGVATEFAVPSSANNYKDLVSMIMAAYLSARTVTVIGTAGTCAPPGGRTQISSLHLQ